MNFLYTFIYYIQNGTDWVSKKYPLSELPCEDVENHFYWTTQEMFPSMDISWLVNKINFLIMMYLEFQARCLS